MKATTWLQVSLSALVLTACVNEQGALRLYGLTRPDAGADVADAAADTADIALVPDAADAAKTDLDTAQGDGPADGAGDATAATADGADDAEMPGDVEAADLEADVTADVPAAEDAVADTAQEPDVPAQADVSAPDDVTPGDATDDEVSLPACVTANCAADDNVCTAAACVDGACAQVAVDAACDDGNACTENDACAGGACAPGAAKNCDDGNACTDDGCDAANGCVNAANAATCTDGDACTGTDTCIAKACVGTAASCDDGNVCTNDSCDKLLGCQHVDNTLACSDGDACTQLDTCQAGACVGANPVVCKVLDQCHIVGTCDPSSGKCSQPAKADATACDDGNFCTLVDTCKGGNCTGSNYKACTALDVCHVAGICDVSTGACSNPAADKGAPCTDSNVCTVGDGCDGGVCLPGVVTNCTDGNVCTNDACDTVTGCKWTNAAGACSDGNACTLVDACKGGVCVPGAAPNCDDSNLCTDDSCDMTLGCVHVNNAAACNDGNACTQVDTCQAGGCVGGSSVACQASDPCHDAGLCNTGTGVCSNPAKVDGALCDDGSACTHGDACTGGTCVASSADFFSKTFGGAQIDIAYAAAALATDVVLAGTTTQQNGSMDMRVMRVDSAGKVVWDKTIDAGLSESASAVAALPVGVAVAGKTTSGAVAGGWDGWLVKLDDNGNKLPGDVRYGGTKDDDLRAIALLSNGFALAGSTRSKGAGDADMWLLRTDADGKLLWDATFGGTAEDVANALIAVPDGFVLAGYSWSKSAGGGGALWVVRTDLAGKPLWEQTYGGANYGAAQAITAQGDGFAIAGFQATGGAVQPWVLRIDTAGFVQWQRLFASTGADFASDVRAAGSGLVVAGSASNGQAGWLARLDANGQDQLQVTVPGGVGFHALAPSGQGFALVGDSGASGATKDDFWLVRTDAWGHATCAAAGTCAGVAQAKCDDGNPCTLDLCDAVQGCTHANVADGFACSAPGACDAAGACMAGACVKAGEKLWSTTFGGAKPASARAVAAVADGLAFTGSYDDKAWFRRTDRSGAAVAEQIYGDAAAPAAGNAILAEPDGFVVAGNLTQSGSLDGSLFGTDLVGAKTWAVTFGVTGFDDGLRGLNALGDGYVAVGKSFGNSAGGADGWLVLTGPKGANPIEKRFGGTADDEFNHAVVLPDGLALAGSTKSSGAGDSDAWLVRTDLGGNLLWQRTFGSTGADTALDIAAVGDGFAIAGTQGAAAWLARLDASGNLLWQKTFADTAASVDSLRVLGDGFALAGGTLANGTGTAWLARADVLGNLVWSRTYGSLDTFETIAVLPDGFGLGGVTTAAGSGPQALMVRTDAFGNIACAESGTCATMAATDCDDHNDCTADLCDAAHAGCYHQNLADGSACAIADTCAAAGVCAAGTCAALGPKVWQVTQAAPASSWGYAAASWGPWLYTLANENGSAVLRKLGPDGAELAKQTWPGAIGSSLHLTADAQGLVLTFAQQVVGKGQQMVLQRVEPLALASVGALLDYGGSGDDVPGRPALLDNGHLLLPGSGSGATTGLVELLDAQGNVLKETVLAALTVASAAAPDGNGGAWVVGHGASGAILLHVAADGTAGVPIVFDSPSNQDEFHSIARLADGSLLLAGTQQASLGGTVPWFVHTDASGASLRGTTWPVIGNEYLTIDAVSGPSALLSGRDQTASGEAGVLAWIDVQTLELTRKKLYPLDLIARLQQALLLPDGGIAAVGGKGPDVGSVAPVVLRTDAFGNTSCADSGTCISKATNACDDQNACTADVCDTGHGGCWHTALALGTGCANGGLCDGNGTCATVSGKAGIPAGSFLLGCVPGDAACNADENPQHAVALDAYWMDTYEVTVAKYKACVAAGKCTAPATTANCNWNVTGKDQHPVNCVSWSQSDAFCKWAGDALPSEAQWERAARGGADGNLSLTGAATDCSRAVFDDGPATTGQGCDGAATMPVGSKPAGVNGFGLYDVLGNVWEWTADWYDAAAYGTGPTLNPTGPLGGSDRTSRGGGFDTSGVANLRMSQRSHSATAIASDGGFRCARPFLPCTDSNPCTADSPDGNGGCTHAPLAAGAPCPGGLCNLESVCTAAPAGMSAVPAGTFWMGCNSAKDAQCKADESPQHKVTLSPYFLDTTETTVAQYRACVLAGKCTAPGSVLPALFANYPDLIANPVNFVTWDQARTFCKQRGGDLPTEAQWEMAARGRCEENGSVASDPNCAKAMRTYPWGEATPDCAHAILSDGITSGCNQGLSWAAGSAPSGASPFGLQDMAGNIAEWNRDWYATYPAGDQTDPAQSGTLHLLRGGAFANSVAQGALRASARASSDGSAGALAGLRCVQPFASCDDGNPCTIDGPTGPNSCGHSAIPAGSACPGGLCNATGTCVQAPAGMAPIPAGTFWMGCNDTKDTLCAPDESPQHRVTLSGYFLDLTETTVAQFKACVDAGKCTAPSAVQPAVAANYPGLVNNPVNFVNWTQAEQYCLWRGAGYDLPTEAQWEMAARGRCEENGSTAGNAACAQAMRTYPWGEAAPACTLTMMFEGSAGCGTGTSGAVAQKAAGDSPFGVHDLAGNVWEWTRDWFATPYPAGDQTDPVGPASAANRAYRGGGFNTSAESVRSGNRSNAYPGVSYNNLGLRCMRVLAP